VSPKISLSCLIALTVSWQIATAQITPTTTDAPEQSLGWQFYANADYAQALTVFQNTLTVNPKDTNALRGQAYSLYKLKQYHLALLKLPHVSKIEKKQNTPPSYEYVANSNNQQAIAYNAQTLTAWSYYYIGKPRLAQSLFYQSLEQHPDWSDSLTGLGYSAIAQDKRNLAQSSFSEALYHLPNYQPAQTGMAEAKEMRYGFKLTAFYSYGDESHESPNERGHNETIRLKYTHRHNSATLQFRHNDIDPVAKDTHNSFKKTTASWMHFYELDLLRRAALRFDLQHISNDNHLYDNTIIPYLSLMYLDQKKDQYYDIGYSQTHYKNSGDQNDIKVKQASATIGHAAYHHKIWSTIRGMYQKISFPEGSDKDQSYWSGTALIKYHVLPKLLDISGYATLGERQYTYKPNLLSTYDRTDKQTRTLGLSAHYFYHDQASLILDINQDRFAHGGARYSIMWYSLGLTYAL
jgi:Tfp pilus assembly protein PilF